VSTEMPPSEEPTQDEPLDQEQSAPSEPMESQRGRSHDLQGLLARLRQLPDSLSDEWSRALEDDAVRAGIEEFMARLNSFNAALVAHYEKTNAEIEEAGGQPLQLTTWPPSDADLVRLVKGEPGEERRTNAELVVAAALINVAAGLDRPGKIVMTFPAGTEETFWESGGFALLGAQADLLSRMQRPSGVDPSAASTDWLWHLECAGKATRAGLPEAAALYLRLALPGLHAALAHAARGEQEKTDAEGVTTGLAGGPAPTLDGLPFVDDALLGIREAIAELIAVVEGYSRAEVPDLAQTVLLSVGVGQRLGRLVAARLLGLEI
jgi:hypothetical protein